MLFDNIQYAKHSYIVGKHSDFNRLYIYTERKLFYSTQVSLLTVGKLFLFKFNPNALEILPMTYSSQRVSIGMNMPCNLLSTNLIRLSRNKFQHCTGKSYQPNSFSNLSNVFKWTSLMSHITPRNTCTLAGGSNILRFPPPSQIIFLQACHRSNPYILYIYPSKPPHSMISDPPITYFPARKPSASRFPLAPISSLQAQPSLQSLPRPEAPSSGDLVVL